MKNDLIEQHDYRRKKIYQYLVGQAVYHQVDPGLQVLLLICQGWFTGRK